MSDKPKRRPWQLHLSTLIVLSFVAGGLIWLNMPKDERAQTGQRSLLDSLPDRDTIQGWPFVFYSKSVLFQFLGGSASPIRVDNIYSKLQFIIDCSVWLLILAVVAFACEWPARRRRSNL